MSPLWQQAEITMPEFRFHKETKACYGKMKGQNTKTKGTRFNLFLFLYVDDGFSFLKPKEDMAKGKVNPVPSHIKFWIAHVHGK
jgi:hypothetical protein